MIEKILFPAIKTGDNQLSLTQDISSGHASIVGHLIGHGAVDIIHGDDDKLGYITNFGRFVDRTEAKHIALLANQIKNGESELGLLYSYQLICDENIPN